MFEKEITSGNHVSYHFCVDKFDDNFHPKSRQHNIEKQLRYVDIDLSPYELGITSSNTTSDGDYVHVSYLRRLNNGFMRQEVLGAKNIVNKPKVNEDPKDALLKQYMEEINRLKAMLEGKDISQLPQQAPEGGNQINPELMQSSMLN